MIISKKSLYGTPNHGPQIDVGRMIHQSHLGLLAHTLFSVSQKLSLSGKMLKMDEANDEIQQLKLLGSIFIGGLK